MLEATRALVVGIIPFVALWLVSRSFGPLAPEHLGYALTACTLWLAGSIITWIDPSAAGRAGFAKDLRDLGFIGKL